MAQLELGKKLKEKEKRRKLFYFYNTTTLHDIAKCPFSSAQKG